MIVHDLEDEAEHERESQSESSRTNTPVESLRKDATGPSTRRKAKETQFKLGVGRPIAIGGTGARAPSSSTGKPRSRRGRAIMTAQPSERAIQEEEEEVAAESATIPDSLPGPSSTAHEPNPQSSSAALNSLLPSSVSAEEFRTYVSTLVEPLKTQIGALQADLERAKQESEYVHSLRNSIAELTSQLATLQGQEDDRTRLVESLREELAALKLAHSWEDVQMHSGGSTITESSPTVRSGPHLISLSSPPKSNLGKRQRDLDDITATGSIIPVQAGAADGQSQAGQVLRPSRKKVKLDASSDQSMEEVEEIPGAESDDEKHMEVTDSAPRPFTVFSGPEESPVFSDGPPPTTRLSELFTFPVVTPPNGSTPSVPTSTAQGVENRGPSTGNAFSFNFATSIFRPMTSTPAARTSTALPPPEPPTSPSPVGPGTSALPYPSGGSRPRSGSRPTSRAAQSQAQLGVASSVAPIAGPSNAPMATDGIPTPALTAPQVAGTEGTDLDAQGTMYANPMRVGSLGVGLPGIVPLPMPPDTPDQPMKRTMYGTELEGDSRFGDFGVEGVAMGFWTGAAPRF
ncbi:hypothetical protein BDY19DRAFT_913723 [Irpex rosettiformis]|uniref:Uncharacterized protein n=1 Tax=Irpex rosettiformis TaxID=378272 RepID=A0ACB8UKG6_9APHY|nr:hypothetical protein BDY19DRAFT_913723 [Irpex rosettiformis]